MIEELKSSKCGGGEQKCPSPEGFWIVRSLLVMEEGALGLAMRIKENVGRRSRPSDIRAVGEQAAIS